MNDQNQLLRELVHAADTQDPLFDALGWIERALAALQAQQSTQGDTPAAEVSDAELRKTIDALRDPGTVSAFYNGYYTLTPDELRRAILALRPQAAPMTLAEVAEAHAKAPYTSNDSFYSIFSCGIRAAEAHHGITAHQATKEQR